MQLSFWIIWKYLLLSKKTLNIQTAGLTICGRSQVVCFSLDVFYNPAVYQKEIIQSKFIFKVFLGPSNTGNCCLQILFPACNPASAFPVTRQPFNYFSSQSECNQNNRNIFSCRLLLFSPSIINNEAIWYRSPGFIQEVQSFSSQPLK